jgi:hypothetical protein
MDLQSKELFDTILKKEVTALTPSDIDVLRARASYLTLDQKEAYADVLQVPNAESSSETVTAPPAASPKKKAK